MSTAKNPWTRAEHSLLLRAWQEVVQEDGSGGDGESKGAAGARVFHRFTELTKGMNKRTQNATYLQKAVLSFNFNFILHYNLTHGANAWVSLGPEEREQVYNREKTTSYYFVDLDPSMIATMASIRKRLANSGGGGGGAAGSPKKRGPKAKVPRRVGNAKQVYRAIIDVKCSDEEDEEEESSNSCISSCSSSSSEFESDSSVDRSVKRKKKNPKVNHKSDKSMRVDRSAMVELLELFKRGARRMEKLLLTDDQRYRRNHKRIRREATSSVAKKDERGKVKQSGPAQASQPPPSKSS